MSVCATDRFEEAAMRFEVDPSQDLGLQHVLENGLIVLRGGDMDEDRKGQVLNDLLDIVSEADRGSEALRAQSLTFALDERPAFERFTLFFRYLKDTAEDLPAQLSRARIVLEQLQQGADVPSESRQALEDFLAAFLEALERERALAPLHMPRQFHYH